MNGLPAIRQYLGAGENTVGAYSIVGHDICVHDSSAGGWGLFAFTRAGLQWLGARGLRCGGYATRTAALRAFAAEHAISPAPAAAPVDERLVRVEALEWRTPDGRYVVVGRRRDWTVFCRRHDDDTQISTAMSLDLAREAISHHRAGVRVQRTL